MPLSKPFTSLGRLKVFLGTAEHTTDRDAELEEAINWASEYLAHVLEIDRDKGAVAQTLILDSCDPLLQGLHYIRLNVPITDITELKIDDAVKDPATYTIAASKTGLIRLKPAAWNGSNADTFKEISLTGTWGVDWPDPLLPPTMIDPRVQRLCVLIAAAISAQDKRTFVTAQGDRETYIEKAFTNKGGREREYHRLMMAAKGHLC